ncbi:MAG TPA: V-type ATP synthase subunit F [Vicinamibacterales bacterium]|nr:V-type ATP synthase subunit F [Vicinamibacterales bacterium]
MVLRSEITAGVELAGLAVTRVDAAHDAADTIRHAAANADLGIVLVDDALYRTLPRELRSRFDREALPIIAAIPAPHRNVDGEAEAYILEILKQAIGYRVRLR